MTLGQKLIFTVVISGALVGPAFGGVPFKGAYWTFEEEVMPGQQPSATVSGELVAGSDPDPDSAAAKIGTVVDATGYGSTMRRYGDDNAPSYTNDVPGPIVPATGMPNNMALLFQGTYRDLYTQNKDINNPDVIEFTLEASFKVGIIFGGGFDQAIVTKESKAAWGDEDNCANGANDCTSDAPPLSLKIIGTGEPLLTIQIRDGANVLTQVVSLAPIQAGQWYHAAVTATATELKLYLNSLDGQGYVLQGTAPITGGSPLWKHNANDGYGTNWNIGKGMWARRFAHSFGYGVIDEVRLSNTALQPDEFLWYQPPIPGDLNLDRKVNEADLDIFIVCATGSGVGYIPVPDECPLALVDNKLSADLDSDGDVDMTDFGILQAHFTGD